MRVSSRKFYKITGLKGEAINGGSFTYDLPKGRKPGEWAKSIDYPHVCNCGYHLATPGCGVFAWAVRGYGDDLVIWEAEGRGRQDRSGDGDKVAFQSARLTRRVGRILPWMKNKACGARGGRKEMGDLLIKIVKDHQKNLAKRRLVRKS